MAAFGQGGQSPTSLSRTLERVFDDAQYSGVVNLSGRKLKDYPKVSSKYDLSDTATTDISKNRFTEIPPQVCSYLSTEQLLCYHNVIRCLPTAIIQLQALTQLNVSRNQLSVIPPFICQLQSLEVLIASNNKLVSLPEEIGRLERLMELDVSCNEITQIPQQIGDLESLRNLNIRRNLLVELPEEISRLKLRHLDFSTNRISTIPNEFRKLDTLDTLILDNNPLTKPPSHVCTKGRVHIMKFLQKEAEREDKKQGILNDAEMRRGSYTRKSMPSNLNEFQYLSSESQSKRHTIGADSGYNTTDSSDKRWSADSTDRARWSPSEIPNGLDDVNKLAVRAAAMKEQRHERVKEYQRRINSQENSPRQIQNTSPRVVHQRSRSQDATPSPSSRDSSYQSLQRSFRSPNSRSSVESTPNRSLNLEETSPRDDFFTGESQMNLEDEFTRELNRQKAEYEARKKNAERLRREKEEEEEREERRRAAMRLQEEQHAVLERQREEARRKAEPRSARVSRPRRLTIGNCYSYAPPAVNNMSYIDGHIEEDPINQQSPSPGYADHTPTPSPGYEDKQFYANNNYHSRMTDSNTSYPDSVSSRESGEYSRNNGIPDSSPSPEPNTNYARYQPPVINTNQTRTTEDEFRARREAMLQQQRHEAQMVRRRFEEEKYRIKQIQKEAVQNYVYKRSSSSSSTGSNRNPDDSGHNISADDSHTFSRDSTPNSSFNGSGTAFNHQTKNAYSPGANTKTNSQYEEYNNMPINPNFTMRRQLEHVREELEQMENLRRNVESRLKVTLPDDLSGALKDGVVLCHLANSIRPRAVSSIHVPSPAVPKLSMAKCRRNVENFLEACRKIGVDKDQICLASDILEEKGFLRIATTVQALLDTNIPKQSTV